MWSFRSCQLPVGGKPEMEKRETWFERKLPALCYKLFENNKITAGTGFIFCPKLTLEGIHIFINFTKVKIKSKWNLEGNYK